MAERLPLRLLEQILAGNETIAAEKPQLPKPDEPKAAEGKAGIAGNVEEPTMILKSMLHAERCGLLATQNWRHRCASEDCKKMQDLLVHIKRCNLGKLCRVVNCEKVCKLYFHWHTCKNEECSMCGPERNDKLQEAQ